MTDSSGQAPAGWYDDPHAPGRMRYFDGAAWTNHFHEPGKLPDIGSWINSSFSVFSDHWPGAAILAFVTTIVSNLIIWFGVKAVWTDVVFTEDDITGFTGAKAGLAVALGVFAILWQGISWIALNRYLQRAHFDAKPTVGEAITHGLRRLPKYLFVVLAFVVAFFGALTIMGILFAIAPVLGVFAIFGLLIGGVWIYVKVAFISSALAAAPADTSVFRVSAGVSADKFWAVFGRLLLVTFVLGFAGNILLSTLGSYGSPVDQQALLDTFQDADSFTLDFNVLFPSSGQLAVVLIVSSIVQAAISLISTSAIMRLYLDSGAPSDIG